MSAELISIGILLPGCVALVMLFIEGGYRLGRFVHARSDSFLKVSQRPLMDLRDAMHSATGNVKAGPPESPQPTPPGDN